MGALNGYPSCDRKWIGFINLKKAHFTIGTENGSKSSLGRHINIGASTENDSNNNNWCNRYAILHKLRNYFQIDVWETSSKCSEEEKKRFCRMGDRIVAP